VNKKRVGNAIGITMGGVKALPAKAKRAIMAQQPKVPRPLMKTTSKSQHISVAGTRPPRIHAPKLPSVKTSRPPPFPKPPQFRKRARNG
jgi:hypothetical protein